MADSLYNRMGGEEKIRSLCNELYELHTSDPLTAAWYSPDSEWNERSADEIRDYVFTFFSAGIGGPHTYEGRSMVDTHAKMREMKPITETAFHALCYHVITTMKKHNTGGDTEIEEVLAILMSLKSQVMQGIE